MITKTLTNLIHLLYPRNICAYTEKDKYLVSEEYKRLNQIVTDFDTKDRKVSSNSILEKFENDKTLKKFADFSLFHLKDRCMTFNVSIIEGRELYTISLFISIIIPYYVINVQKNMIEIFFSESEITELENKNTETRKINELVLEIETIIEDKFLYRKLPNKLLNFVVADISFQDSQFGYFTMYNAFFNNVTINDGY
ncbi:hypothetical protein [Flavobacterium hydatis]|uniref:Uncharacterized protein n=1 Tax=Flavobacterium hydatis TaxID=991 RepID=A0A086AUD6_FLAHY|nr:hypothetical protein [Flavobacterium hydatis]KFF20300.1 hypothetical protein IW20_00650 [Flavobacterium hydatis]OXA98409.1 hypothetical protein B0A62_01005 [Flavobacterium hydatis]